MLFYIAYKSDYRAGSLVRQNVNQCSNRNDPKLVQIDAYQIWQNSKVVRNIYMNKFNAFPVQNWPFETNSVHGNHFWFH